MQRGYSRASVVWHNSCVVFGPVRSITNNSCSCVRVAGDVAIMEIVVGGERPRPRSLRHRLSIPCTTHTTAANRHDGARDVAGPDDGPRASRVARRRGSGGSRWGNRPSRRCLNLMTRTRAPGAILVLPHGAKRSDLVAHNRAPAATVFTQTALTPGYFMSCFNARAC